MTDKLLDNGKYYYILTNGKNPLIFDKSDSEDMEQLEEILYFFFDEVDGLTELEDFIRVGIRNDKSFHFMEKWSSQLPPSTFNMGEGWALPRWDTSEFNKGELRAMREFFYPNRDHANLAWYAMNEELPNLMLWKEFFKMVRFDYSPWNIKNIVHDYNRDLICLDTLMTWDKASISSEVMLNEALFNIRRDYPEDLPYDDYFEYDDWIIRSPVSYEEVYMEGEDMNNCVGGYLSKIRDEDSEIYFMRRKDEPNTSYITIEVENGVITQHFRASNRDPYPSQREVIEVWASERNYDIDIKYTERMHYGRV